MDAVVYETTMAQHGICRPVLSSPEVSGLSSSNYVALGRRQGW